MKISTAQSLIVLKYPRGRDWPERGNRMRGAPTPTLSLGPWPNVDMERGQRYGLTLQGFLSRVDLAPKYTH